MRGAPAIATIAALLALPVAGCGDDNEDGASGAASAIPPDPALYLEADISGEGEQHSQLDAILTELGEVPLLGASIDPRGLITTALETLGAENGVDISYEEDFEPWLGDLLAVGYTSFAEDEPGFVLALDVSDEQTARDSIERITAADAAEETDAEYDGVSYQVSGSGDYALGVFDEKFVLATTDQFEAAIDASRGDSVATGDTAAVATDILGGERLATMSVDADAALDLAVAEGDAEESEAEAARAAAPEIFERPIVASVAAGERAVIFDTAVGHSEDGPQITGTDLLEDAPGDAFAALGVAGLGDQVDAFLDRVEPIAAAAEQDLDREGLGTAFEDATGVPLDELLAGVGDAVVYGRGDLPEFEAGLAADVEGDAPVRVLDGVEEAFAAEGDTRLGPPQGGTEGFSAEPKAGDAVETLIRFINAEIGGEQLTVSAASSREAAGKPAQGTLADNEVFQAAPEAVGSDYELIGYADLGPILDAVLGGSSLLDVAGGGFNPEQAIAAFVAEKLGFAGLGVRYSGDYAIQRTVIGLG